MLKEYENKVLLNMVPNEAGSGESRKFQGFRNTIGKLLNRLHS